MTTRREFLKSLVFGAGGLTQRPQRIRFNRKVFRNSSFEPRKGLSNLFLSRDGKPILVCIEGSDVRTMLSKGLQALGGLDKLVTSQQDVMIKPNLVLRESASGYPQYPTMSSPDTIRELIYLLKDVAGRVSVGDQGGEEQTLIYEKLDLGNVVVGLGADLINFEAPDSSTYNVRRGTWSPDIPDFKVFSSVYEAQILINLCNLKRHSSAFMTSAIKNNFGALQGRSFSGTRGFVHRNPNYSKAFIEELADIAALINPELTIVDARHIMIGNGPLLSAPGARIREGVNRIVISGDMVAADAYCAERILGIHDSSFNFSSIQPTLDRAQQLELGTADLNQVEILEIDEFWEPLVKKSVIRR
ncbi:DUF362 domain-containing protein [Acidobacteriota bacterium]